MWSFSITYHKSTPYLSQHSLSVEKNYFSSSSVSIPSPPYDWIIFLLRNDVIFHCSHVTDFLLLHVTYFLLHHVADFLLLHVTDFLLLHVTDFLLLHVRDFLLHMTYCSVCHVKDFYFAMWQISSFPIHMINIPTWGSSQVPARRYLKSLPEWHFF